MYDRKKRLGSTANVWKLLFVFEYGYLRVELVSFISSLQQGAGGLE